MDSHVHLKDKEVFMLATLALWRANAAWHFTGLTLENIPASLQAPVKIWDSQLDSAVKISAASSIRIMAEIAFRMTPDDEFYMILSAWVKDAL